MLQDANDLAQCQWSTDHQGPNPGGSIYLNKALHHLHHGVRNKRELIAKSD